jgi:xanthosine utilization system XapX-like protein
VTENAISTESNEVTTFRSIFRLSPLIRITLLSLYLALTVPLPFLAEVTKAPTPPALLWVGICIGLVGLYAVLCERVIVDDQTIQVAYPNWVPGFFRKGWSLRWQEVKELKPRTTGQGGLVYYFLSNEGKAYLLPMRIAGFAQMVRLVQAKTGIDTKNVYPLAQPWMYIILLGFTFLLLLIDAWTIATALGK